MYTMTAIELSRQHRHEVAQHVEMNRLVRRLRTSHTRTATGIGKVLLGRVLAGSPQKGQTAGC